MRRYVDITATVYRDPFNAVTAVVTSAAALLVLAWAGQLVTRFAVGGLYWNLDVTRVGIVVALAVSVGLAVPLIVESWRRPRRAARERMGRTRSAAGLAAGGLGGMACLACCSPVLLPALGALFGVSGTTLVGANLTVHRWFLPAAGASIAIINGSSLLVLHALVRGCRVVTADPPAAELVAPAPVDPPEFHRVN